MDKICIKDLAVFAYHGVMKEENVVGQKFLITVQMSLDTSLAGTYDDIDISVNYADVCEKICAYAKNNTFKLIETLAEGIAELILYNYEAVDKVEVTVKKPWAPVHIPVENVSVNIERKWHDVYLSLGSNMGDKRMHLDNAVKMLEDYDGINVCRVSDYIVTAPVGYLEQEDFLNAAVYIKTVYSPMRLLGVIHDIENAEERVRDIHWGPRTLDIDIIMFDDLVLDTDSLVIPHPEAAVREFVLKPLSSIAPKLIHPILNKTISDIYDELCRQGECAKHDYHDDFVCIDDLKVKADTKIVFFGNEGTYSQQAMERFFGSGGYVSFSKSKFTEVMEAVHNKEADYGVVPIENSSTGGITDIYDHMQDYNIYIVGEQIIKIEHALLSKGDNIDNIRNVYSHIQGIRQCESYLTAHPFMTPVEVTSTAKGAQIVSESEDISCAAIASVKAAEVYGLNVLERGINTTDVNSTRFIILSSKKNFVKNASKISISFEAKHESGALFRILSHFSRNGINLEKIESRPIPDRTWEYRFFVDIAGNLAMQNVKNALGGVAAESEGLTILGNY